MDEILVNNFMVFDEVVAETPYDLVVGDEAWDVDYFLHENPELKRFAFAWMTDFVGWLPMPDGGARRGSADRRLQRRDDRAAGPLRPGARPVDLRRQPRRRRRRVLRSRAARHPRLDRGELRLRRLRHRVRRRPDEEESARLRERLGYGQDDLLCLVTVGGSGVGETLLRRVLDAVPLARRLVPELHFLVVTGPRIDPASLPRRRGATVRGYLPDLHRHLAACDLAVVQGGLTTCMELTASRRPFLYVPLQHHFEQNFHVRHRLEHYGAGRCLAYDEARDPDVLAEAIAKTAREQVHYRAVETDGAATAAAMLAELL